MMCSRLPYGDAPASFSLKRHFRNACMVVVVSLCFTYALPALAGEPQILFVEMEHRDKTWTAQVTVRHGDTGWDHYADAWRLLDSEGRVLGTRTLYHPHETEQPFTRGLSGVAIPTTITEIDVQAHDKVHGWGEKVRIPLTPGEGERYRIR